MIIAERINNLAGTKRPSFPSDLALISVIASKKLEMDVLDGRALIKIIKLIFDETSSQAGFQDTKVKALTTKFRDAGRRSAPWKPTSSRVPGRPQDGSDGNRIARWKLPEDHKFYANEVNATLVEVKYYLQALSMLNAPETSSYGITKIFTPWLIKHHVSPGDYLDPIQRVKIDFLDVLNDPRLIQSGHLDPLDRDGTHIPSNTYLLLARSNQIQGNMKIEELIDLMSTIVQEHKLNPFS